MILQKSGKVQKFILFFSLLVLFSLGFSKDISTIFIDDFEGYVTTQLVKRAYAVWEDGAILNISMNERSGENASRSMQIDVLGPNTLDGSQTGSIYHSLPLTKRNWSGASAFRFWIKNPDKSDLWLTLNFKESYNEYWSIRHGAQVLMVEERGGAFQEDCFYGNIRVPAEFTGKVVIPMESFSVPQWNTARGDEILQLKDIESYALGITLNDDYPRTYIVDSVEVIAVPDPFLFINGERQIQIPDSGQLSEFYSIQPIGGTITDDNGSINWTLESKLNPVVTIDKNGTLTIPSSSKDESILLIASVDTPSYARKVGYSIKLFHTQTESAQSKTAGSEKIPPVLITKPTAYDQFVREFETWAREYRPLFVVISVGFVLLFIFILSSFQSKLK